MLRHSKLAIGDLKEMYKDEAQHVAHDNDAITAIQLYKPRILLVGFGTKNPRFLGACPRVTRRLGSHAAGAAGYYSSAN